MSIEISKETESDNQAKEPWELQTLKVRKENPKDNVAPYGNAPLDKEAWIKGSEALKRVG